MTTYLVTGGAGFIGSNFIKYITRLHGASIKVIVLDVLTYAGNVGSISEEIEQGKVLFVKGDIGDGALVERLLKEHDVDYVVNFAAESHVDRSITNPRLFLETNILGTHTLLDCARKLWCTGRDASGKFLYKAGKKYLQVSTDEVYGSLRKDFDTARELEVTGVKVAPGHKPHTFGTEFFTESTPLSPRSPYSASKTSADMIVMAYYHTYGMPVNVTRCSNNYGPYHFPEKLIPLMIKNVLEGKKLPVYGKGLNVRDWLYVEDHCKAIDMVVRRGRLGEVYNVGGYNEESNINIVRLIIDTIGRIMREEPEKQKLLKGCSVDDINYGLIEFVPDRPGHDMRYAIDPTKIANELGWCPDTPFEKGIEKTIRWNLDNQAWVESVLSGEYQRFYKENYEDRSSEGMIP